MTRVYPLILIGLLFFVFIGGLLMLDPDVASEDATRAKMVVAVSAPFYFMLTTVAGLHLIPTLLYLLAFGTMCSLVSAWRQHPHMRFALDALVACSSLPLFYQFLHSGLEGIPAFAGFFFIVPCLAGMVLGVVYASCRGLLLR